MDRWEVKKWLKKGRSTSKQTEMKAVHYLEDKDSSLEWPV